MLFKKSNKIDEPLARLTKKERNTQITNIKNETGIITTDPIDIQMLVREYYKYHTHINLRF